MEYLVLILDDEPLILEGLTKAVDWTGMNCRVVGSASNGIDGKRLIEQLRPDIVITDIRMPGLTGLDLAEWNFKVHYAKKVIILTAYSDFEYARKAIHYQVEDYILKPIDFKKLNQAVQHAADEIKEIRLKEEKMKRLENEIENSKELATSSLLFNIARYGKSGADSENLFLENMMFQQGVFLLIKLYNLKKEQETELLEKVQNEIVSQFRKTRTLILKGSADDKLVFLCQTDREIDMYTARERVKKRAERIINDIGETKQFLCIGVVSNIYKTKEELKQRYQEGSECLKKGFFASRSGILEDDENDSELEKGNAETLLDELLHHLKHGNTEEMTEKYLNLLRILRISKDVDYAIHVMREIYRQASRIASRAGMVQKPSMDQSFSTLNYEYQGHVIKDYLNAICCYIKEGQNLTGKVKWIVAEYYGDSQFGLAFAAEELGVNSSYLSRLFKKETDKNFVDYLTDIRIEKAIYLLETTKLKNSDIAAAVGFEDERYFGKVFKKKQGITPKQWREENSRKIP